jgi:hypothetical protein
MIHATAVAFIGAMVASTSVDLARAQFATTSLYVFRARITGDAIAPPTPTPSA